MSSLHVYVIFFFKDPSSIIFYIEYFLNCFVFWSGDEYNRKVTWVDSEFFFV